jgi:integrase
VPTKLTVTNVKTLPDGKHADAAQSGLYLWVRSGGKSRVYQHRYTLHGVAYTVSLGSIKRVSLEDARKKVITQQAMIVSGKNPAREKAKAKQTANGVPPDDDGVAAGTLRADVMAFYAWRKGVGGVKRGKWSESHAASWLASFENHILKSLGGRQTASLKPAELVDVILPVWTENNDTGTRLCQRLQAVISHAIKSDDDGRFGEKDKVKVNVADGLLNRLPTGLRPEVQHMRAAKWTEMSSLYAILSATEGMPAKALRVLIVTGAPRAHEVFGMRWGEVWGNLWHVPAKRVKGRTDHIIPLPDEAMALLRSIMPDNPAPSDFVFSGAAAGGRINHQAMRLLLRALGIDYDVHGFRTTFKSWCLDNLKHPLDIPAVELALDHAIGGKVAEAYRDTSLINHRRILNERYCAFLTGVTYSGAYEVPALSLAVDNTAAA